MYLRLGSGEQLSEILAVCSQDRFVGFPGASVALDTKVDITELTTLPHPNKDISRLLIVDSDTRSIGTHFSSKAKLAVCLWSLLKAPAFRDNIQVCP